MAKFTIPLINQPRQALGTILGGQSVQIRVAWQPSDQHWYLSLQWRDGRDIVAGVRMITGANLTEGARQGFQGTLAVEGTGDPGRNAWRDETHRLTFTP